MLGASRTSIAVQQEYLAGLYDDVSARPQFDAAGDSLLAVVSVLEAERPLRAALAEPATLPAEKDGIIEAVFVGKVPALTLDILKRVSHARWSSDADMIDATEEAGASLILMSAESQGNLDRVEEELFRFGRAIDANADLQMALTDPASPTAAKAGIVRSLLDGKATTETVQVLAHVVGHLRGRRVQDAVTRISELAATRRGRVIADIRSAIELTHEQESRLAAVLKKLHGRDVELNVAIDPSVIGGIEVRVGDEVIDGTVANRIEQARRRLAG